MTSGNSGAEISQNRSERSLLYRETAVHIVEAIGGLVRSVYENAAAEGYAYTRYKDWLPAPPLPGVSLAVSRQSDGRIEQMTHGRGGVGRSAASYFCSADTSGGKQTVSELKVGHDGQIETRDYLYPPDTGSISDQPPFEPVADDPDALSGVKVGIDLAVD
jgi:hypothetical protein